MEKTVLKRESLLFSISATQVSKELNAKKEYILCKQFFRSATAIGAMIFEAKFAESKKDFIHKYHIALKEVNETQYWLELVELTSILNNYDIKPLLDHLRKIIGMLVNSLKTLKRCI